MTYPELLAQGRALSDKALDEGMRSLMRDDRCACLAGWLDRNREAFVQKYSTPTACENGNRLAHAAGAIHAMSLLEAQLMHLLKVPPATSGPRKEEDE